MAWQTPKTNWGQPGQTVPIADDFNRIEGNIQHLQDTKETPAGAQAKAEAAAGAVQAELNMHKADNAAHVPHLGTTTNSGNNYSITSTKVINDGAKFSVKFNVAATGAATLKISSDGTARALKKPGGGDFKPKAGIYTLIRDGSNFQLLGEGGEYGTATASDVLSGKTIGTENGLVTGTMPNRGAVNKTLVSNNQEYTIPSGYHNGLGKIKAVITGLAASVIKAGTTVGGILGTFTSDANAVAGDILSGKTAYKNGAKLTGTMTNRGAVTNTITTQGGQYTIPSGYHNGSGKVTASFSNLKASNIKKGVNIGGVVGNVIPAATVSASQLSACNTDAQYIFRILATDGTSYNNVETLNLSAIFFTVKFGVDSENNRGTVQATTDIYIASGSTYTKLSAGQTGGPYSRIRIYNPHRGTVTLTNNYGAVYRAINYSIFIS